MLVLVGEQHLVDEAAPQQRVLGIVAQVDLLEHLEGALADVGEVGAQLGVAQDRQLAARPARVLDRVVEAAELAVQGLAPADRLHQPELLEVGDVPEIPGQRAEQRRVDAVELLVVERLDQLKRRAARLGETFRDRFLGACRHLGGDAKTLYRSDRRPVKFSQRRLSPPWGSNPRFVDSLHRDADRGDIGAGRRRRLRARRGDGASAGGAGAAVTIADLNAREGRGAGRRAGRRRAASSTADVTDAGVGVGGRRARRRPRRAGCGSRSAAPGSAGRSGWPTRTAPTTSRSSRP